MGKIFHLLLASSQSEAGTPKAVERQQLKKLGSKKDCCCQLKVHGDRKTLYTKLQFRQDTNTSQSTLSFSSLLLLHRTAGQAPSLWHEGPSSKVVLRIAAEGLSQALAGTHARNNSICLAKWLGTLSPESQMSISSSHRNLLLQMRPLAVSDP